jgi:very-short-patch-repair endonuclease
MTIELIAQHFDQQEVRFVKHPEGTFDFGVVATDLATVLEAESDGSRLARSIDEEWKGLQLVETLGGPQLITVIWEPGVKQLLQKSRKPKARLVAEQLGINLNIHRSSIEADTLRIIKSAFQHLNPIEQFFVSGYRIDLYFPQHRIAVECDEPYHSYRTKKDIERQDCITSILGCSWIRYEPQEKGFCIGAVINQLIEKIYA